MCVRSFQGSGSCSWLRVLGFRVQGFRGLGLGSRV